jgi:pectate lyase-like protein
MFVPNTNFLNLLDAGADPTGVADSTTAINNAFKTYGKWWLPSGTYKITGPINITKNNSSLQGSGFSTILAPSVTFSGANMINITGSFCDVSDLQFAYANTTFSSNPAADAIQITGAVSTRVENIYLLYINGWILQSTGGSSQPNYNTVLRNIRGYQCKQGFHLLGTTGSGYGGIHFVNDCYSNQTQQGDGWLIEDFLDLEATNIFSEGAAVVGNSGYALHIKGNCNAIYVTNFDLGPYPGPAGNHVVLIESDANGNPGHISFNGGIIEGGQGAGVNITAGFALTFSNTNFFNNGTYGVNILGGDGIGFQNCIFDYNGSAGTTGRYDVQNTSTGRVTFSNCQFRTPQGTTPQHVNAVINDVGTTNMQMNDCSFSGTGFTPGTIFASYPKYLHNNYGYNPVGDLGQNSVGASPFTFGGYAIDAFVYLNGGTVSSVAINGTATGNTSGCFFLPAQGTMTITHTGAPNIKVLGN